jgi:hypothetical protein
MSQQFPKLKPLSVLVDQTPFLCPSAPFGGPFPVEQASQWFHSFFAYKYSDSPQNNPNPKLREEKKL